ncbi:hypothetical protein FDECE_8885 [Fusarium decemcellulare]|nr:hypothetical protein FDECE_8885 [Fusarium decemcellulare]
MPEIQASITIGAPPSKVWEKLIDLSSWPQWNTFVTSIQVETPDQQLYVGSKQIIHIRPNPKMPDSTESYSNVVTEITPHQKLVWEGSLGSSLVFNTEHWCKLEPVTGQDGHSEHTLFTQGERFAGLLAPVVGLTGKLKQLEEGYIRMNGDLKQVMEAA